MIAAHQAVGVAPQLEHAYFAAQGIKVHHATNERPASTQDQLHRFQRLHAADEPRQYAQDASFRALYSREAVLASDWYKARLAAQQSADIAHWEGHVGYLKRFLSRPNYADVAARFGVRDRLIAAEASLAAALAPDYPAKLVGTLGVDPTLVPVK